MHDFSELEPIRGWVDAGTRSWLFDGSLERQFDAVVINAAAWPMRWWHKAWGRSSPHKFANCTDIEVLYRKHAAALAQWLLNRTSVAMRQRWWLRTSTAAEISLLGNKFPCFSARMVASLNAIAVDELGGVIRVFNAARFSMHDGSLSWPRSPATASCCHFTWDGLHATAAVNELISESIRVDDNQGPNSHHTRACHNLASPQQSSCCLPLRTCSRH